MLSVKEIKYGADFIKIMATGGFYTPYDNPSQQQLNDDEMKAIMDTAHEWEKIVKNDYFKTTKNKNEITFSNNSKENISSILMMIFNTWKQHIYYLNLEENRYLAELRDALLPELMSGKIDISDI